ncbi:MAG: MarR family transcriptional regulator [Gemmatimonadales bacterium]
MFEPAVASVLAAYPLVHAACRRRVAQARRGPRPVSDRLTEVLEQLDRSAPVTVGDLALRAGVTAATMSLQVSRLVRLRLAQRTRDRADARRVLVRLTEAGEQRRGEHSLLDPERVRAALARLPPGEREAVAAGSTLLARAARDLLRRPAEAAPLSGRNSPR